MPLVRLSWWMVSMPRNTVLQGSVFPKSFAKASIAVRLVDPARIESGLKGALPTVVRTCRT